MSKTLTLFEHESKSFAWTDRDCAVLERMRLEVGTEVLRPTVRRGTKAIQAAQHVGVFRLRNRTVQVLPKIYRASEGSGENIKAREATANLLRMLAYAGRFLIREHQLAELLRQTDDWFEILTRLFAVHLREEWQRGAYRTYRIENEDDQAVLKGRWRIADQLRRPSRQHRFSVSYDEFTADNSLNRVFRFVVERLWQLTRDNDNRQLLGELRQWLDEVTLVPSLSSGAAPSAQLTRLNERYRPLLNLAQMFLQGGALRLAAGDLSSFAFVFDMNQLFESFITAFIMRHANQILSGELRACDYLPQSRGVTFFLARSCGRSQFQTRPDIAFRDCDKRFPLLIDTKYKRLEEADRRLGVSQSDFYQMYAYAHRYSCNRVILLYPQIAGMAEPLRVSFDLEQGGGAIQASTIDLCIDMRRTTGRRKLIEELRTLLGGETP
jgi:5-methylcytosine-specific restriction enzyme subunit McrC